MDKTKKPTTSQTSTPPKGKWIPLNKIADQLKIFCSEQALSSKAARILFAWLQSFPRQKINNAEHVQLEEAQLLFANFKKYLRTGDPDDMTQKRGLRSKPVDIIEFVTSKHYVGNLINLWPGGYRQPRPNLEQPDQKA